MAGCIGGWKVRIGPELLFYAGLRKKGHRSYNRVKGLFTIGQQLSKEDHYFILEGLNWHLLCCK